MNQAELQKINKHLEHISPVGKRIYTLIKQQHMTKTDLRSRTKLPAKQLDDELNSLASFNLIKALKKGEKKNVKTWVLFHEKQDEQQEETKANNQDLIDLILKKNSTISAIKKQAIKHAYSLERFQQIIQLLKMRGEVFVQGEEIRLREMNKIYVPCITCEVRRLCSPGNTVSPENCPYLLSW